MDPALRAEYDRCRPLQDKPFRAPCYAPWTSLYFHLNGDVVACCKNTTYVLGNVARDRLLELWRGRRLRGLRAALAADRFGLGCELCAWQIEGGQHDQVHARTFDGLPLQSAEPEWPAMLEFTLSNTCNLACVMCYGQFSSTIRAHRDRLPPLPAAYGEQFFADVRAFLPHLHVARFFGGEPFLARECHRIWEMMIEDRLAVPVYVVTNGTQYGSRVERVLEGLPVHVSVSMDGITRATVESIRVGVDFDKLQQNVQRFLAYTRARGTSLSLSFCLMRQNWREFGPFLEYAEELGARATVNTVVDPDRCSLYTLPPPELAAIAAELERAGRGRFDELPRHGRLWSSVVHGLAQGASAQQVAGVRAVKDATSSHQQGTGDPLAAASALISRGRCADALAVLDAAPTGAARYEQLTLRARALRLMRRHAEAETAASAALAAWDGAPDAWIERAWTRLESGAHGGALADARAAVERVGADAASRKAPDAFDVLALTSACNARFGDALAAAARLLALRPHDPKSWVHRAWVLERAGRAADAVADAERALALDPADAEARAIVQRQPGGAASDTDPP